MGAPGYRTLLAARAILLATLFALAPRMEADAIGLKVDLVPSARIEEGWESNVSNASTSEVSSLTTRVTPGLSLMFRTLEGLEIGVSGNYERVWYHNSDVDPATSDTFYFRVISTGKEEWRLTPTFSIVPSVSYINTTNSSRRTQLVPSGDPVVPPATITNYGETKSETIGAGVRFNYLMTQSLTLGVDGNYSRQRFDTPADNAAQTGLTDSSTFGAGTSVSYRFSPRTNMGVQFAGGHQTYEDTPDSNTLSGEVTFGYQFSPTVRLDGGVGVAHIRRSGTQGTPAESASTPSGRVNLSYRQETFTFALFGSGDYSGGSGYGEATRQYTVGMRLSDRFARDWTWNLSGAYQVSKSVFSENAVNIHAINGTTGIQYLLWRWATLDLTGNLNRQTSSGQFGEDLNSYSALLGFTAAYPINLY